MNWEKNNPQNDLNPKDSIEENHNMKKKLKFANIKKHILNLVIIIISTSLTNIFSRFLIYNYLNSDIEIFSVKSLVVVAVFPIVLLFFEKDIKVSKLIIISVLYTFFFSFLSNYM